MASTRDASPTGRRTRNGSIGSASGKYEDGNGRKDSKLSAASKLRHPRFAFGGHDKDDHDGKGPGLEEGNGHEPVWKLDTDLSNVSDIVQPRGVSPKDKGAGAPASGPPTLEKETSQAPKGSWFAPESWAVKKPTDDPARRAPEPPPDAPQIQTDDEGRPYCLRIFRSDAGFTTISSSLSTTVMQILEILARKSFLQEELENYEIVMWKNDLSRTLDHRERPLLMQKSLLEQAGYQASDRIADIGREDNSYLVRFTFLQTRLGGYSSRNQEPEFNKHQKFNHVDLEGRSLITIPIALYTHSWEIQTLNLSRNLALDVPKDFMQRCFNLRELKYISCEAFRLPLSFAMAPRLTFLDISNNRIDDLNHAQLNRLHTLVSLKHEDIVSLLGEDISMEWLDNYVDAAS
ncbi:cysteinyl-tRNA synthetase [Ascosphaera atra]|nr:cysteinyl-tRNA synthetase [Ascosphaera atra]